MVAARADVGSEEIRLRTAGHKKKVAVGMTKMAETRRDLGVLRRGLYMFKLVQQGMICDGRSMH